jgi:hypothetical protein
MFHICFRTMYLKGSPTQDFFRPQVFSRNSFSQFAEYPIEAISNFDKILGDIRNFMFITGYSDTGNKLSTGVNDTSDKVSPV